MRNKKGVSAVIATVLIILITIAAVAILWRFVIPLLTGSMGEGTNCFNANLDDGMKIGESITSCDSQNITLQVSRGTKDYNLTDLQVVVADKSGNSKSFYITNSSVVFEGSGNLPLQNEEKVYKINCTKIGMSATNKPVSIKIAPVVTNARQICESKPVVQLSC